MEIKVFKKLNKVKSDRQLVFFPYLGGHADSFSGLADMIGGDIEIWSFNLPGHGIDTKHELLQDINSVMDLCLQEINKILKKNCIFFGHSMGGIIAYFLTQSIFSTEKNLEKSITLILSACSTPAEFYGLNTSHLSDKELLEKLTTFDNIFDEILYERSLRDYFLPIFRADFKILESSSLCDIFPLDVPVYFLWGENDKIVTLDSVIKWSRYFSTEINLLPIKNAPHMFLHTQPRVIAQLIEGIVKGARP